MKKKIVILLVILFLITFMFIIIKPKDDYNINLGNIDNNHKNQLKNVKLESRVENLNKYNYKDFFTVGWIQVEGTNIDMPIFTSIFRRLEEKGDISPDFSYGWRHINYKLGENRMVISAHNIINVSSNPLRNVELLSDFEALMSFVYHDFAKNNQYIMYTDENGEESLYVIYSVGFTNPMDEEYYSISYDNKDKLDEYINSVKNNSIYNYDVNVNNSDEIISLITCTRFFGLDGDTLFRVDARKVRENEKTYKYNVEVNKNYEEISKRLGEEDI